MADKIAGTILRTIYGPTADGYTIYLVKSLGKEIAVGTRNAANDLQRTDDIEAHGKWRVGKQGPMFAADVIHRTIPQTPEGIYSWLMRAKVPGIGKARAAKLVKSYGEKTIDAIVDMEEDACKIVGKKIELASKALEDRREEAAIGSLLALYGIGGAIQRKITERYGKQTRQMLLEKPYDLIVNVKGVAFTTADKIAAAASIPRNDPQRIQAGIIDALRDAINDGNTALPQDDLLKRASRKLMVDEQPMLDQLDRMGVDYIVPVDIDGAPGWAVRALYTAERELAKRIMLKTRDQQCPSFPEEEIIKAVAEAENALNLTLNAEQRSAAIMALSERISIINGGPGTGKTHTLRVVLAAWQNLARRIARPVLRNIAAGAPTGRAAKRITETSGIEGKTIHRLLEFDPQTGGYVRNKNNPIEAGIITIDETSMLDVNLALSLARAWGNSRVLFIGDVDQLPSVGPGRVLGDMISSKAIPVTSLVEVFRQSAGSAIAVGADDVKHGRSPSTTGPGQSDLVFIELEDNESVVNRVIQMYADRLPPYLAKLGVDPTNIQILSPGKQSDVGTVALNGAIQEYLFRDKPKGAHALLGDKNEGRVGDRVIQIENDYERGIFNGDIGRIIEIDADLEQKAKTVHVDFGPDAIVSFPGPVVSNLHLSYALTIHKSQGSEYQAVIMPIMPAHAMMMKRQTVYTGMTRAKRLCIFIGSRQTLRMAINRQDTAKRTTLLATMLK